MKQNTDWKDALAALRGDTEEIADETPQNPEEKPEESSFQKSPLTVVLDRKGRNGKTATIIEGFTLPQDRVEEIARKLKQKLGVGGSVREGEILIQGDHLQKVKEFLKSLNFKTR